MQRFKGILIMLVSMVLLIGCAQSVVKEDEIGTLVVSVNPSLAVNYLNDGTVGSIIALNEDGEAILSNYKGFEGKHANLVVKELIQLIGEAGYLVDDIEKENRQITIELDDNSHVPDEKFINDIEDTLFEYLNYKGYKNKINMQRIYRDGQYPEEYEAAIDQLEDSVKDDINSNPTLKRIYFNKYYKRNMYKNQYHYDHSDYDVTDYEYSDYDDTDYDTDYDDTDYDDTDYDN